LVLPALFGAVKSCAPVNLFMICPQWSAGDPSRRSHQILPPDHGCLNGTFWIIIMLVFMMLTAVASAVAAGNARRGEKVPGGASHTPRTPRHGKVRPQLCCELGWVGIAVFPAKIIQLAQSSSASALSRKGTRGWKSRAS